MVQRHTESSGLLELHKTDRQTGRCAERQMDQKNSPDRPTCLSLTAGVTLPLWSRGAER